jgi:hypothetical protein
MDDFNDWCPVDTNTTIGKAEAYSAEIKTKTDEQVAAIKEVHVIWNNGIAIHPEHPYVVKKRIEPIGIKQLHERIIVPLYNDFEDREDSPVSLQYINSVGEKRFHPDCPVSGCFHAVGNLSDTDLIYVTEGYATGITVYKATGVTVVVAFNSGNLRAVCAKLKETFPKIRIVIAADNDLKTENKTGHNSGKESAMAAAKELDIEFVLCPVNSDFNDLFNEHYKIEDGYQAVRLSLRKSESGCEYDKIIKQFNSRYGVTWFGGKCVILKEVKSPGTDEIDIQFTADTDLRKYFANRLVPDPDDPKRSINPVDYWLKSPERRQYKDVVFEPGKDLPEYYNMWKGLSVKPVKGDWTLFRDHIFNIITNGDDAQFHWVMSWMARIIQDPGGERPGTALVLRGGRGAGKGVFVNCFGRLFGQHYIQLAQQGHLLGRFNHHLKNKVLVFADEGFWAGDKQSEGAIKNMITEPRIVVEQKGKDAITVKNCINIVIASNNEWVVPAGEDERRFYVADVSNAHQQEHAYFKAIFEQLENGGYEAMLYDLQRWEYSIDDLRQAPKTSALLDQIKNTMDVAGKFWIERIEDGTLNAGAEDWSGEIDCKELYGEYLEFAKHLKERFPLTPQQFGKSINKLCQGVVKVKANRGGYRINVYRFPALEECRKQFERLVRMEGQMNWE